MSHEIPDALEVHLEQRQKELDLILAIDHIRDTIPEPSAMLVAIADALADFFQADLCMICLQNRETGELELRAVNWPRRSPRRTTWLFGKETRWEQRWAWATLSK